MASTCSVKSTSVHSMVIKSSAGVSVGVSASANSSLQDRRPSCGTLCSSNSSCLMQKRKVINPLQASVRSFATRTPPNAVKQRVMSAKLIKLRSIQSKLNDANFHLTELSRENRALKTLQNRQDKALRNYEGTNADLPRLIKSHEDEIRVVQEKNKVLRKSVKELSEQIKLKDDEINCLGDHLKHLTALSKDKNLEERHKLTEKVEDISLRLKESDQQISVLNRKLMLETKNFRFKLNSESTKHKHCQRELGQALSEIDRLNLILDGKNRTNNSLTSSQQIRKRFSTSNILNSRDTISLTSLAGANQLSTSKSSVFQSSTDINLEPIKNVKNEENHEVEIMKSPEENILARLSSGNSTGIEKEEKMLTTDTKTILRNGSLTKNRPTSVKLDKLSVDGVETTSELLLNDYKNTVASSAENFGRIIEKHQGDFNESKLDTDQLIKQLKEADLTDKKLRKNKLLDLEIPANDVDIVNKIWTDEYTFRNTQINGLGKKLTTEALDQLENDLEEKMLLTPKDNGDYQKKATFKGATKNGLIRENDDDGKSKSLIRDNDNNGKSKSLIRENDNNGKSKSLIRENDNNGKSKILIRENGEVKNKSATVSRQEKTKLLATLRAIDNGDSSFESTTSGGETIEIKNHTSDNLMKELFGDM